MLVVEMADEMDDMLDASEAAKKVACLAEK